MPSGASYCGIEHIRSASTEKVLRLRSSCSPSSAHKCSTVEDRDMMHLDVTISNKSTGSGDSKSSSFFEENGHLTVRSSASGQTRLSINFKTAMFSGPVSCKNNTVSTMSV